MYEYAYICAAGVRPVCVYASVFCVHTPRAYNMWHAEPDYVVLRVPPGDGGGRVLKIIIKTGGKKTHPRRLDLIGRVARELMRDNKFKTVSR